MENDGVFLFKYIMKGEDIFAGAETITNTYNGKLGCGMVGTYLLNFELEKLIRNCKEVEIITPCVIKYFEQVYGNDYKTRFNMTSDRTLRSFSGINSLFRLDQSQVKLILQKIFRISLLISKSIYSLHIGQICNIAILLWCSKLLS